VQIKSEDTEALGDVDESSRDTMYWVDVYVISFAGLTLLVT